MPLTIRNAERSDLAALLSLYRHLDPSDRPCSLEVAERRIEQIGRYPGSCILVGHADDVLAATCTLIVIPNLTRRGLPYGLIENVVTQHSFRGRGFGKEILNAAVETAWTADCYKVMLMTGSKRPSTLAFYVSAGFEQSKTGFQVRRLPVREDG